jgi:hypothetical protein
VDGHGLVHVDDDEVIVPRLGARVLLGVQPGRLAHDAEHGVDVRPPLRLRQVTPEESQR